MGSLFRIRARKGMVIICALIVFLLTLYELNVSKTLALSGQLSESLQVITNCPPDGHRSSETAGPGIPNIIHQTWKTTDVSTYSAELEASHEWWKKMYNPVDYEVKLWTDDDVLQLVQAKYPWLLSTYTSYPQDIQRADLARLAIVHAEGGIYADLDVYPRNTTLMRCLQDLDLQNIFAPTGGGLGLSNHFFMAERGSDLLLWTLYEAKRRAASKSRRVLLPYLDVFWTTGPMMVTAAFREYAWLYSGRRQSVGLLEQKYVKKLVGHAAGRSWHGSDGKALNYVADHAKKRVFIGVLLLTTVFGLAYVVRARYSMLKELFTCCRSRGDKIRHRRGSLES